MTIIEAHGSVQQLEETCGALARQMREPECEKTVETVVNAAVRDLALRQKRAVLLCLREQLDRIGSVSDVVQRKIDRLLAQSYPQRPERYGDWQEMWLA